MHATGESPMRSTTVRAEGPDGRGGAAARSAAISASKRSHHSAATAAVEHAGALADAGASPPTTGSCS